MFKRTHTLARGLIAASVLFSAVAFAGIEGPPAEYTAFLKMKPMEVMHMIDKDKKGYVTKEEFMKFHEEMFKKMDRNFNNILDLDEFMLSSAG